MEGRNSNEDREEVRLESSCSDSECVIDGPISERFIAFSCNGVLRLTYEDDDYTILKHRFYLSIGSLSQYCHVVAAYRNLHSSPMGKARLRAFGTFLKAMGEKRHGNANAQNAWLGTSMDGAIKIMTEGFELHGMPEDGRLLGGGIHLTSERSTSDSVLLSPVDESGLRHLVICRVILGSTEIIAPGSRQLGPSSGNFDSGVDNRQSPTRYIVWYPNVNIHILPMYALSVKLDFKSRGLRRNTIESPTSPWMPVSALITVLSKSLPPSTICMLKKFHVDYMERKITRTQLVLRMRQLIGDRPLISAIQNFQDE